MKRFCVIYSRGELVMKKIIIILLSLLTIVGVTLGGYQLMKQVEFSKVEKIVQSDEVKEIIESSLKKRHKGALEEGNIIQSYSDGRLVNEGGGMSEEFKKLISGVSNE